MCFANKRLLTKKKTEQKETNHSAHGSMETSEQYKTRSGRAIRRPLRSKDYVRHL